jgi:hypothetical protein
MPGSTLSAAPSTQTPERQSSARTRLLRPARCGDRSHGLPWFRKKLPAGWPRARTTSQSFGACPWRCLYVLDSASYPSDIAGRLGKTALASPVGLPGSIHCMRDGGSGNHGSKVVPRHAPISSDISSVCVLFWPAGNCRFRFSIARVLGFPLQETPRHSQAPHHHCHLEHLRCSHHAMADTLYQPKPAHDLTCGVFLPAADGRLRPLFVTPDTEGNSLGWPLSDRIS